MNVLRSLKCWLIAAAFGLCLTGCGSVEDPVNPKEPWNPGMVSAPPTHVEGVEPVDPGTAAATTLPPVTPGVINPPPGGTTGVKPTGTVLRVGDLIKVTFSDINPPLPVHEERIREDGNITLPLNVSVRAAGRTVGELQEDIRKQYVPIYYIYLTVTVRTDDLTFFVGGEVRNPGRQLFSANITVTRGIDTAGGFTEFANKKKIELIRASGSKLRINYEKALKSQKLDYEVFPGDRIYIPSKGAFGN